MQNILCEFVLTERFGHLRVSQLENFDNNQYKWFLMKTNLILACKWTTFCDKNCERISDIQ